MLRNILGYQVEADPLSICIDKISKCLQTDDRECRWMACINPHSYAIARKDSSFREALKTADWLVPDGVGVVIAGRILGRPIANRITGFDVFSGVMSTLNIQGGSVFFLGSTSDTLAQIREKLPRDYPNVSIAGTLSPPFRSKFSIEDTDAMISSIKKAQPDVLWVGLTAPKQEMWIAENAEQLPVKFAGAIGAVFDFYTGKVKRSHPTFQRLGLEWLPRLLQEPRRLWRRMFISAPIFMFDVVKTSVNERIKKVE